MLSLSRYAEELQPISGSVYKVEKVLRKRRRAGITELLVKWVGFDSSHNQWIPETDVVERFNN
jgi:hypothetical protein